MISAITASYGYCPDDHVENLIKSLQQTTSKISEVIAIYAKEDPFYKEEKIGNIIVKHIAPQHENIKHVPKGTRRIFSFEKSKYEDHSFALHKALEYTTQRYILFTDPDVVFFEKNFDELYLKLYKKYDLNIIGISHYESHKSPFYKNFPTLINCLIEKDKLPNIDFLKGKIKIRPYLEGIGIKEFTKKHDDWPVADGAYLYPTVILDRYEEFPNPDAQFQTGVNLFLWDKDNGSKNITFISESNGSDYFLDNVKCPLPNFNDVLPNRLLLKHVQGWQKNKKESIKMCREWLEIKKGEV